MPAIDKVADRLTHAVIAQHWHGQLMSSKQIELVLTVIVFAERPLDLAVVAPAAKFESLITPLARLLGQLLQR